MIEQESNNLWEPPTDENDAIEAMLDCEKRRDYENAALNAVAAATTLSLDDPEASSLERRALVYATLHQGAMIRLLASRQQPQPSCRPAQIPD